MVRPGIGVVHAVLEVGLHPRAGADAGVFRIPPGGEPAGGAPLDRVHRGVAGVGVRVLAAAVVEAAPLVHVVRRGDHVNALGVRTGRGVLGVVDAVADTGGDLHAVRLVPADGDR